MQTLIIIQLLTGVSLMPPLFCVVCAREETGASPDAVGWFLLAQVTGGVLGNLLWARQVEGSTDARRSPRAPPPEQKRRC